MKQTSLNEKEEIITEFSHGLAVLTDDVKQSNVEQKIINFSSINQVLSELRLNKKV
ncbi:MAG: hypothetical protein JO149_00245, partial [Gammaproteobacteria bacterium]|nr:hypothetical protein [Gammaproteobacteria bacterium]